MARPDLLARLQDQRKLREAQGRIRVRRSVARRDGMRLDVGGKWLTGFCSNDYLGLSQQFEVVAALQDAAGREGAGGTASHLVCGHHVLHEQLEREMADWLGYPRALLFDSGFMANLAVQQALLSEDSDVCVQDRLNHASLLDATRLAGCRLRRYPHLDSEGAMRQLKNAADGAAMLATDGVFSMDGDIADLPALAREAKAKGAWLMVDDAHGFGPLGANGGGIVEHFGLSQEDVPVLVGTLGKAFGTAGAFVAGSEELIESLIQFARPYIYTTSQPPALACATLKSLELLRTEHWRREHLNVLIRQFRQGAEQIGLELMDSFTPIQPIMIGDAGRAVRLSQMLRERGLMVTAIRPPTVPAGSARLRVTLTAAHSEAQVQLLLKGLADCFAQLGPEPSHA